MAWIVRETVAVDGLAGDAGLVAVCVWAVDKAATNKIAAREMDFTRFSNLGEIESFPIVSMVRHAGANAKDRKD
jgi:hypothetical protein